jgi:hypothetical protein
LYKGQIFVRFVRQKILKLHLRFRRVFSFLTVITPVRFYTIGAQTNV